MKGYKSSGYLWFVIALVVLVLLAWSPWISKGFAERRVVQAFEESQKNIVDGCGFNCPKCGVFASSRIPFGYRVSFLYSCGMKVTPSGMPNFNAAAYVSPLGTVHIYNKEVNLD